MQGYAYIIEVLVFWRYNPETRKEMSEGNGLLQKREGKVLRVFSSGRWLPRNQG
jgi:hypothetical protein